MAAPAAVPGPHARPQMGLQQQRTIHCQQVQLHGMASTIGAFDRVRASEPGTGKAARTDSAAVENQLVVGWQHPHPRWCHAAAALLTGPLPLH
jgi:hypothetical protein